MLKLRSAIRNCLVQLSLLLAMFAVPLYPATAADPSIEIHAGQLYKLVKAAVPVSKVEQQVHIWSAQLSAQKPFKAWKQAEPLVEALGPGTHSWLATLKTADGRIVGYMVIQAAEDGTLRLGEYGLGPNALFDPAALKQTLSENGLIDLSQPVSYQTVKYYAHPFAAVWQVAIGSETYWVDAKTNEVLPMQAGGWDQLKQQLSPSLAIASDFVSGQDDHADFNGQIAAYQIGETFDAYERLPWLTGESPLTVQDEAKVQHRIGSSLHLRYVSEPYGDQALYAVPVIGFLRTSGGRLDLAVDMAGTRFIPIGTLKQYGKFYN